MLAPKHVHACAHCKFLGAVFEASTNRHYDLYYCEPPKGLKALIARFGTGDEYQSGMLNALTAEKNGDMNAPLVHALQRARAKGYLPMPRATLIEQLKRTEKECEDLRERVRELEARLDMVHRGTYVLGTELIESKGGCEIRRVILTEEARRGLSVGSKI